MATSAGALLEFRRWQEERRGGPPPRLPVDPVVLTDGLRAVGVGYAAWQRRHGSSSTPTEVHADVMTWQVLDEVAVACYGVPFARLVGRAWWPGAKPPKEVRRVVDRRMEPQTLRVA